MSLNVLSICIIIVETLMTLFCMVIALVINMNLYYPTKTCCRTSNQNNAQLSSMPKFFKVICTTTTVLLAIELTSATLSDILLNITSHVTDIASTNHQIQVGMSWLTYLIHCIVYFSLLIIYILRIYYSFQHTIYSYTPGI